MILSSYERMVVSLGIPRFDSFLNFTFFGLRFLSSSLSGTTLILVERSNNELNEERIVTQVVND